MDRYYKHWRSKGVYYEIRHQYPEKEYWGVEGVVRFTRLDDAVETFDRTVQSALRSGEIAYGELRECQKTRGKRKCKVLRECGKKVHK